MYRPGRQETIKGKLEQNRIGKITGSGWGTGGVESPLLPGLLRAHQEQASPGSRPGFALPIALPE